MGSYAESYLGPFHVSSSKGAADPYIMGHFRATDKVMTWDFDALPTVLKKNYDPTQLGGEGDPPSEDFPFVFYRVSLSVLRDRLAVQGYTLATACEAFAKCIQLELIERRERAEEHPDLYAETIHVLEGQTIERWLEALRRIASENLGWKDRERYVGTLIGEMLNGATGAAWYGYPGIDSNIPLRIAVEACSEGDELLCDVTDLVWSESWDAGENFAEHGVGVPPKEYFGSARTLVLTEGRFDAFVLSKSLELLFPHLRDYYSFMDFDNYDPEGGAAALVKQVKAFAGAGVVNRMVAIFDNDAASHDSVRSLKQLKLPTNIKVMHLPELEFLRNYPTLGPAGESTMDVNGLAGNIEMYLGKDVLTSPMSNQPVRVQWKGFVAGVGKYHGEILDKSSVQERFREKLTRATKTSPLTLGDWDSLRRVLRSLFDIFHHEDAKAILGTLDWQYENGYSRD
jgi:hypothetical protein